MSSKFAKDLKRALKQAIANKEGKLDLRTTEIEVPEPPTKRDHTQLLLTHSTKPGILSLNHISE